MPPGTPYLGREYLWPSEGQLESLTPFLPPPLVLSWDVGAEGAKSPASRAIGQRGTHRCGHRFPTPPASLGRTALGSSLRLICHRDSLPAGAILC